MLSFVALDRSMPSMPRNTTILGADTPWGGGHPNVARGPDLGTEINAFTTSNLHVTLYIFEPPFAGWAPMTGVGNSIKL